MSRYVSPSVYLSHAYSPKTVRFRAMVLKNVNIFSQFLVRIFSFPHFQCPAYGYYRILIGSRILEVDSTGRCSRMPTRSVQEVLQSETLTSSIYWKPSKIEPRSGLLLNVNGLSIIYHGRPYRLITELNGHRLAHIVSPTSGDTTCYYPYMPIGKVWIYRLLFACVCLCLFVRLRISPARIKLAASNFVRWFMGVLDRESPILGNLNEFAPSEAQNRTNRPPTGGNKVQGGKSVRNRVPMKFDRHVWIYGCPRRRTYLLSLFFFVVDKISQWNRDSTQQSGHPMANVGGEADFRPPHPLCLGILQPSGPKYMQWIKYAQNWRQRW